MLSYEKAVFCENVRSVLPDLFCGKRVLDVGSLDQGGTNRYLFTDCEYVGLDWLSGKNVDQVGFCHDYSVGREETFDVVLSVDLLQFDVYFYRTLRSMTSLLKKGGLLIVVCSTLGKRDRFIQEKKIRECGVSSLGDVSYYRPLMEHDFRNSLDIQGDYVWGFFRTDPVSRTLFFVAQKRGRLENSGLLDKLKQQIDKSVYFDEVFYLRRYPEVVEAIKARQYINGLDHFKKFGLKEGREFRTVWKPIIYGFMHVAQMNHWKKVLSDQFLKIERSGLLAKTEKIYIGVAGSQEEIEVPASFRGKVEICFRSDMLSLYEFPVLAKVQEVASQVDCFVWYIHTKGVSTQTADKENWRQFMEYFIIEHWEFCYDSLVTNEVSGVMWHESHEGARFFAGNFWWATSQHIRCLPLVQSLDWHARNNAERWVVMISPKKVGVSDLYCNFEHQGILAYGLNCHNGSLGVPKEYSSFSLVISEEFRRSNFDEEFYLSQNPDVNRVVKSGEYRSGYDHYLVWGRKEGREARFNVPLKLETVLLTACLSPLKGMPDVVITDMYTRAVQYIYSLLWWSKQKEVGSIILCESSGVEFDFSKIAAYVASYGKKLEILRIDGSGWDAKLGKGHAEAKIFDYVGEASKLLGEVSGFFKVTGRIGVENFPDLSKVHQKDENVFRHGSDSTKFFKVGVEVFRKHLMGLSGKCDDRKGETIEERVTEKLKEFFWVDFFLNPIMIGQSGGFGDRYNRSYGGALLELAVSLMPDFPTSGDFQPGKFDEAFYLTKYPDVVTKIQLGEFDSGFSHYFMFGRREGREYRFR